MSMMTKAINPMIIRVGIFLLTIAIICTIFQLLTPAYLSIANIKGMFRAMSISGIVALGLTFVIVLRKFDLSLPGVASLAAMTLGFILAETGDLTSTFVASIGIGFAFGALSGALIGYGRLPDVVTTIAIGSIATGAAFIYNGGATYSKNFFSSGMININIHTILGLQIPVFILVVVAILAFLLLHATRYGNAFYAVGENPTAAKFSGISVPKFMIAGFGICGATVGLSMLLQVAAAGAAFVNVGNQIMLPAYTAVYLGAALFARPSVPATLAGAFIMTLLLNGFTLLSAPYYYSDVVVSSILIVAIILFDPNVFKRLISSFSFSKSGLKGTSS